jgi:hypothetical protein
VESTRRRNAETPLVKHEDGHATSAAANPYLLRFMNVVCLPEYNRTYDEKLVVLLQVA